VPHRPLALVSGLTLGDYLLWNWSLSGNHVVLALVSGLTLPPLAVACVWLLALGLARLIARLTRRSPVVADGGRRAARDPEYRAGPSAATPDPTDQAPASAATSAPSGKIAA
jgi:hypothetical protein